MSSQPKPRHGAKPIPFSQKGPSRSHASRSAMTTSIRKAKRGQMIEMKRHMKIAPSTAGRNPYLKVDDHVKETIAVAGNVIHCCSQQWNDSMANLFASLERLCVLISPTEFDNSTTIGDTKHKGDASYDSSLAGIAANAILTRLFQHGSQMQYLAFLLADALASILNATAASADSSQLQAIQVQAAIVLTQLSATEPPPPPMSTNDQEQFSPYGHPSQEMNSILAQAPTSWCFVVVNSRALEALIQKIGVTPTSSSELDIVEKCVWATGNLAGDSEMAREALVKMGAVPRLTSCVSFGLSSLPSSQLNLQSSLVDLLRNAVWSLVNLVRNRVLSIADLTAHMSNETIASLLLLPTTQSQDVAFDAVAKKATCYDVTTETCWLLFFLTDKDSKAIEFICQDTSPLLQSITTVLSWAIDAATQLYNPNTDAQKKHQLSNICLSVIPTCRVIGNIAYEPDYGASILIQDKFRVSMCLGQLVDIGTLGAGQEASLLATTAAETAGACLYYSGSDMPDRSTNACHILVQPLCNALINPLATFDVKREVAWALWNAVNNEFADDSEINNETFRTFQQELLREIVFFSPTEILQSLAALLTTNDMDTIEAAIRLIDILLKRLDSAPSGQELSVVFEEVGLVDALWRVCDNDSEESEVAEIAANILDEYYEKEVNEHNDELFAPTSNGNSFQFQAPTLTPESGFDFSSNNPIPTASEQQQYQRSMGRGRGRGQQIPAWMEQSQES